MNVIEEFFRLFEVFRNGDQYAGESHFVYKNEQLNKSAVLGFFMESRNTTDWFEDFKAEDQWKIYFDQAQKLIRVNDSITIDLTLSALMGNNLKDFWRYNGSLTIPPCAENVIWTVFKQPIFILNYEFELFRDDLFFQSYRGPQPLYNREISRSFSDEKPSEIPDEKLCSKSSRNQLFVFRFVFFISFFFVGFV